ncbi:MAG: hydrogenase formation protein HypD [Spirochaetota bacterium]
MNGNFRNPELSKMILQKIIPLARKVTCRLGRPPVLMEVCGTHTTAIARLGLRSLLAGLCDLRSGPGCPVCVTAQEDLDQIIALAQSTNVIVATFGDLLRVPGTYSSLEIERAKKANVKIFYSPVDAVDFAAANPQQDVVFLGIGFETTAPAVAFSLALAKKRGLKNYTVFCLHKLVPPVLQSVLSDPELLIDGLILPGHVSAITGRAAFDFIAARYGIPAVITGFEPVDILEAVYILLKQLLAGRAQTVNGYPRLVKEEGNLKAKEILREYFIMTAVNWRGFGLISQSGLAIPEKYNFLDAATRFPVNVRCLSPALKGCACGDVLKGKITPFQCPLFARSCSPLHPVGPCMVSAEGTCAAYYHYEQDR